MSIHGTWDAKTRARRTLYAVSTTDATSGTRAKENVHVKAERSRSPRHHASAGNTNSVVILSDTE